MVGETAGARGQARRARLRLGLAAAAAAGAAALACAYQGDPPGGPPRTTPPQLIATEPESGAVLTAPPHTVQLQFDEVLNERVAGTPPDIGGAVILSPATGPVNVGWHRSRLTVEPKGGFLPGRIYRVQLLPVLSDLRQNRMRVGHTIIFSTGPALPQAALSGSVVDWVGNRAAVGGLVEAVLLPDSLPYRTLADSTGAFSLEGVPPGDYLVYGVLDQNNNRKREPREAFDTMRVALQDSASVELYAFAHDTVGPRLRTAELVDSITVRVVFDRALDPSQTTDTSMVRVSPAEDSTQALPLLHVFTPAQFDSAGKAEAAERAARDTTQRQRAAPPVRLPAAPAPAAGARPGAPPPPLGAPAAQRRDSTRAMKMLARRPAPTDNRILRMASPLVPGSRYVVTVEGIRGLAGAIGGARSIPLVVPVLRPRRGAADTLPPKARGDTLPPGRPDSARARPDTLDSPAKPR